MGVIGFRAGLETYAVYGAGDAAERLLLPERWTRAPLRLLLPDLLDRVAVEKIDGDGAEFACLFEAFSV